MDRSEILHQLAAHRVEVEHGFGATRLALFGSAARDELRDDSDIDILVAFEGPTTVARFFGLKDYLESLLERRIDLVTEKGLKPRARSHVERDLVDVP